MSEILFVKNILAPYRIDLFNHLEEFKKNTHSSFKFSVYVFNRQESDRKWKLNDNELNFKAYIDNSGLYRKVSKWHLRFNPNFFKFIKANPSYHLVLGSSWNDPNIILTVFLKKIGFIKNTISFWSEANHYTSFKKNSKDSKIKNRLRSFVLNTCDGFFLIPGRIAEETLFERWGISRQPIIYFPNLPASLFRLETLKLPSKEVGELKLIIVARHIESIKGILFFLKQIRSFDGLQILLVGDGPDTNLIRQFIKQNKLEKKIIILGNLSPSKLYTYYQNAHLAVLPSFYDQSPLVLPEAAMMGLPLLVSERCGNHPELVKSGLNGFIFNPHDTQKINEKIAFFQALSSQELYCMMIKSQEIAQKAYHSESIFNNLIEKIEGGSS
jgi:glycosyltransferase involved in cell wall biosynthesis